MYGKMKQTRLRKTGKLFNYTEKIYIVEEKQQFPDGLYKYKLNGYTNRWFPSPFLLSVDTRDMVALGSNIQKGAINFNITFDREAQLLNMQEANRKQAELTPEQLDAQALQIDIEKKKAAAAQGSNLPPVPALKRSKRLKSKRKTQNKAAAQDSPPVPAL
jgi:hypothetical protein